MSADRRKLLNFERTDLGFYQISEFEIHKTLRRAVRIGNLYNFTPGTSL